MAHTYTKRPPDTPPTTNAERIRRYRERQKAMGRQNVMVYLDRETIEAIKPHLKRGEYLASGVARLLKEHFTK
jgi:predicted ATPase